MGNEMQIDPDYAGLFAELDLNADSVFSDPRIAVWRSLSDRENATLDAQLRDGTAIRLHIKRYPPAAGGTADREMAGYQLLKDAGVPAAPIIASGHRSDGSSFIILKDLTDYTPADKLVEKGFGFDRLLNPTADLAALLHNKGLHHRDLYLCHFMVKPVGDTVDAKLIDMARVDRLRSVLTRQRWIIKDLAQFWYSMLSLKITGLPITSLPITGEQRDRWLQRYAQQRHIPHEPLLRPIARKSAAIARHDVRLHRSQPGRNVSVVEACKPSIPQLQTRSNSGPQQEAQQREV